MMDAQGFWDCSVICFLIPALDAQDRTRSRHCLGAGHVPNPPCCWEALSAQLLSLRSWRCVESTPCPEGLGGH